MDTKAHYVVVTGIIVHNGKYLIVKRADWEKAFPSKWTVPGGKMDYSDYSNKEKDTSVHWYNVAENVLRREIMEEVSLEIKDIGYVCSMVYLRSDNIPCLILSLYANANSTDIKLCRSLTEYVWVTLEEAKKYDLVEGMYDELSMLDEFLKTGKHMVWNKK